MHLDEWQGASEKRSKPYIEVRCASIAAGNTASRQKQAGKAWLDQDWTVCGA